MMIDATVVNQMIDRQPSFAREIGQILEIRRRTIQEVSQTSFKGLDLSTDWN
jgi:hypothetical protein